MEQVKKLSKEFEDKLNNIKKLLLKKYYFNKKKINLLEDKINLEKHYINKQSKYNTTSINKSLLKNELNEEVEVKCPFIFPSFSKFNIFEKKLLKNIELKNKLDDKTKQFQLIYDLQNIKMTLKRENLKSYQTYIKKNKICMKSIHSLDKTIKQYNNMKQDLIKKIILTRTLEIQKLSKNELVMNLVSSYIDNNYLLSNYNLNFFFDNQDIRDINIQIKSLLKITVKCN